MINVNVFNTDKTFEQSIEKGTKNTLRFHRQSRYPVNMMGRVKE